MKNPFYTSQLTKKDKENLENIQRPFLKRFCFSLILFALVFISYNRHFEMRLVDILAETSMRDETNSLTRLERRDIKRQADTLFEKYKLAFSFFIHESDLKLERIKNELFITLNPITQDLILHLPAQYKEYEVRLSHSLKDCLHSVYTQRDKEKSMGICIEENIKTLLFFLDDNF